MKFKKGDVASVNRNCPEHTPFERSTLVVVTGSIDEGTYSVQRFGVVSTGDDYWLSEEYLDFVQSALPVTILSDGLTLKVKKIAENAIIPKYAKAGDAAMDLTATSKEWDELNEVVVFGFGIAMEIPPGHVGLIFPRSSNYKVPLTLSNCVGVIDSGYRGEIKAMFRPTGRPRKNYEVGDRICQIIIMPIPQVEVVEVEQLSTSERGESGFGSSGQ